MNTTTRARRRYEIAKGLLWTLLLLTFALLLTVLVLLMMSLRGQQRESLSNQQHLRALAEQNHDLAEQVQTLLQASRDSETQRALLARRAVAQLLGEQQVRLDAMEQRILQRQRALAARLSLIPTAPGAVAPRIVLVPVPDRPSPSPTPAPAPTPARCTPKGSSGRCR